MLGKLTKHEFASTGKLFLPLFGGVILMSLFSKLAYSLSRFAFSDMGLGYSPLGSMIEGFFSKLISVFIAMSVILIIATVIATVFLGVSRFYKNLLGDEGYLMFTLPTSPTSLFVSKLVVAVCWSLLSLATAAICIIVLTFDSRYTFQFISMVFRAIFSYGPSAVLSVLLAILLVVVLFFNNYLTFYTSMSIGAQRPNSRLGSSILAYLGINIGMQFIFTIMTFLVFNVLSQDIDAFLNWIERIISSDPLLGVNLFLLGFIVFYVVLCIPFFFVTRYLLTKKLNLA